MAPEGRRQVRESTISISSSNKYLLGSNHLQRVIREKRKTAVLLIVSLQGDMQASAVCQRRSTMNYENPMSGSLIYAWFHDQAISDLLSRFLERSKSRFTVFVNRHIVL